MAPNAAAAEGTSSRALVTITIPRIGPQKASHAIGDAAVTRSAPEGANPTTGASAPAAATRSVRVIAENESVTPSWSEAMPGAATTMAATAVAPKSEPTRSARRGRLRRTAVKIAPTAGRAQASSGSTWLRDRQKQGAAGDHAANQVRSKPGIAQRKRRSGGKGDGKRCRRAQH